MANFWTDAGLTGLNVLGSGLGSAIGYHFNKKLADHSFELQQQAIREQNEYNSPKSQMERYKEAGLNPLLMYGSGGSASAGNQSQIARYDTPSVQSPDVDLTSGINQMLQIKMAEKDMALKDAQIHTQQSLADVYSQDAFGKRISNALTAVINGFGSSLSDDARAGIESSRGLANYDLGMRTQMTQQDFNKSRTEYQNLNNYQQRYFNKNILPLTWKLKQLEVQGASYSTAMKAIDASLWKDLRQSQIYSSPWKLGVDILDNLLSPKPTPVKKAVEDSIGSGLKEVIKDPFSFGNGPIGYWLKQGNWEGAKKLGKSFFIWLRDGN